MRSIFSTTLASAFALMMVYAPLQAAETVGSGSGCDPRVEAAAKDGMTQMTMRGQKIFKDYMEPSYQSPESVLKECLSSFKNLSFNYDLGFGELDVMGMLNSLASKACEAGVGAIQDRIDSFGSQVAGTINPAFDPINNTGSFGVRLGSGENSVNGNIDIQSSIERWGTNSVTSWAQ